MDLISEVSRNATYTAAGEPETGFTKKGKKRTLGVDKTKPEPWYERGGYTQMSFPIADNPYGRSGRGDDIDIQQVQVIKRIVNTGVKYDGFQEDVASWDKYGDKDWTTDWDLAGDTDD